MPEQSTPSSPMSASLNDTLPPTALPATTQPGGASLVESPRRGVNLAPILLGLVCLVTAALAAVTSSTSITIDTAQVGPPVVLAVGALFVLGGGLGVVRRARRGRR